MNKFRDINCYISKIKTLLCVFVCIFFVLIHSFSISSDIKIRFIGSNPGISESVQIIFTSLNTPNNKEIKNLMIKYMKKRSTQSVWFDVILKHGVKIDTKKYGYIDGTTCVIYDVKNSQTDYQQRSMVYERYLDLCRMKKNNLHRSYRTIMPQHY